MTRILPIEAILRAAPVVPVLVIDRAEQAVPLARALVGGGLRALEITLRTPAALEAIRRIAGEVEGAIVGVGTVLDRSDLDRACAAGARFAVSPGLSDAVLQPCEIPVLPGVATGTEILRARDAGLRFLKFFPAVPAGGVPALKAFAGPFADIAFCPTGGIDASNAPAFLALPNVVCVGGSWVTPKDALAAGDWGRIERLAAAAFALGSG
jgi:2-dehydro-3-deoxyphosphogluconate aldolase/(4S)-4-hydroxy-2-oxoglutarate aldolase